MTTEWVDFKKIKEAVDMNMILAHYGIKLPTKSGDELRGPCPIHKSSERSKNFTVNIRKNAFKCFSSECRAKGNVLDLVVAMEHCSVRDAAVKLQEWFEVGDSDQSERRDDGPGDEVREITRGIYKDTAGAMFEVIATATSGEDPEQLVVYREMFGDFRFRVAPIENFMDGVESSITKHFTLIKAL